MWRVAALRELTAHAQREIAELCDVSLGSANKIVRLEDICWVSSYNIGPYVLSRENHVSPLKRSGDYTYRQVGHMKHAVRPTVHVCVCVSSVVLTDTAFIHILVFWMYTPSLWETNWIYISLEECTAKFTLIRVVLVFPRWATAVFLRCPPQSSEVGVPAAKPPSVSCLTALCVSSKWPPRLSCVVACVSSCSTWLLVTLLCGIL